MTTFATRIMRADDWPAVAAIYALGIATNNATFETEPPTWQQFHDRHLRELTFVAVDESSVVVGWSAASAVSDRCVYSGVAEHGVYVHPDHQGKGVGRLLLERLIDGAEQAGIWTLQTGVFPENTASVGLHERCGFRLVGRRERLGLHHGRWRDVLMLERRSRTIGLGDELASDADAS